MSISSIDIPQQPTTCLCDCEKNRLWADVEDGQIRLQWGRTLPIRLKKTVERLEPFIKDLNFEGVPTGKERALLGIFRAQVSLVDGFKELKRHLFKLSEQVDKKFIEMMLDPELTEEEALPLAPAQKMVDTLKEMRQFVEAQNFPEKEVNVEGLDAVDVSEENRQLFIRHLRGELEGVWLHYDRALDWIKLANASGRSGFADTIAERVKYDTWQFENAVALSLNDDLKGRLRNDVVTALACQVHRVDFGSLDPQLAVDVLQNRWVSTTERQIVDIAMAHRISMDRVVDFDRIQRSDRLTLITAPEFQASLGDNKTRELSSYWFDSATRPDWMPKIDRASRHFYLDGVMWVGEAYSGTYLPDGKRVAHESNRHVRHEYKGLRVEDMNTDIQRPEQARWQYNRLTGKIHLQMQYLLQGGPVPYPKEELLEDPYRCWAQRRHAVAQKLYRELVNLKDEAEKLLNVPYLEL